MNKVLIVSLLFILSFLTSCASTVPPETKEVPAPAPAVALGNSPNLTLTEAQLRSRQVQNPRYQLAIDLSQSSFFSGIETISFDWTGTSKSDLRLDFFKGEIQQVSVNGNDVPLSYNNQYLSFPAALFHPGPNQILLRYTHTYGDDGEGLTRYVDQEDSKVYIRSDFEPYYANRMFPCFDQPDLKATYTLSVHAPNDWQVISSTKETDKSMPVEGFSTWTFPETKKFSTYLFSLHAGEYKVWQDNSTTIPLRLFARQSFAKYVNAKEWFSLTKAGLAFYSKYFNYPYPFVKYDQVISPEFNSGAMENVAAVVFSEKYFSRGQETRPVRREIASVLLHEMAHMWFGNLVTMKWWNDLWLNESFATYMSYLAMSKVTEFKEAWATMTKEKSSSMWEDQLTPTHPIESNVNDVLEAQAVFDGITYGKGASVLKQLSFYIGAENFQKGAQGYFQKYAWTNTERKDFIGSMVSASGRNLDQWQKNWLTTANLNTLQAKWSCDAGKISAFSILQTAPSGWPTLRPHAFLLALLNNDHDGLLAVTDRLKVEIEKAETPIPQVIGKACPLAVFTNYDDQGYFKVALDEKSLRVLSPRIGSIEDDFLRTLVWNTIWQMVEDAQYSFFNFGDSALRSLATEKNETLIEELLQQTFNTKEDSFSVLSYYYDAGLENSGKFNQYLHTAQELFKRKIVTAQPDVKKLWFNALIAASENKDGLNFLRQVLDKKKSLAGLLIDQDMRWAMIRQLAAHGGRDLETRISNEYKKDPSFSGKMGKIMSDAALPNWDNKQKFVVEFKKAQPDYNFSEFNSALWNLFPVNQKKSRMEYSKQFFNDLLAVIKDKSGEEQDLFTALAPHSCDLDTSKAIESFLALHKDFDPGARRDLAEVADVNRRCHRTVQFSVAEENAAPNILSGKSNTH
jgi:aminopeptidase N